MTPIHIVMLGVAGIVGVAILIGFLSMIKSIGKLHYKTIDKAISDGELSKNPTHEEVKQWIKQYEEQPSESQISDTLNYISQRSLT